MPTPTQHTLQALAVQARARLRTVETKLGELRAAYARGSLDAAGMRTQEAKLVATRDAAATALDNAKADLLRESARQSDAIAATALDRRWPLGLLPVRLETRYDKNTLLVRIFPDDIHIDSHDPAVTDAERTAWEGFRKALEHVADTPPMLDLWLRLARDVGTSRALYLASQRSLQDVPSRPAGYARPPRATLLPERFVAHAWVDSLQAAPIRAEAAKLVREPLALAPDPAKPGVSSSTSLDADTVWMTSFLEAENAGMALRIVLPSAASRVMQLVVMGVRASADPATTADDWDRHLAGQAVDAGLSLPPPGSATNALPGQRPLFTTRPDTTALYERALGFIVKSPIDPRDDPRPRREPHYIRQVFDPATGRYRPQYDGAAPAVRVAEALGLSPPLFGYLEGAVDDTLQAETAMRSLLRGAFEPELRAAFGTDGSPGALEMAIGLLSEGSALGPFPTLMVRSQPYGVVPLALGNDVDGNADWDRLWSVADALRNNAFVPATGQVPRIAGQTPADPIDRMIAVLQSEGIAVGAELRLILGASMASTTLAGAAAALRDRIEQQHAAARDLHAQLGGDPAKPIPLTGRVLLAEAGQALPLVVPTDPAPAEIPAQYLGLMANTTSLSYLLDTTLNDFSPRALLFHLARVALLDAADSDTRQILLSEGLATEADFEVNGRYRDLRTRLQLPAPARFIAPGQIASIDDILSDRSNAIGAVRFRFDDLRRLAALDDTRLELLFGAVLGLFSNRLDALYTARAADRLRQLRSDNLLGPAPDGFVRGIQLGAFGWVGAIPRATGQRNAGYVLAPSVQHAIAAGVLLSADHARRIDNPSGPRADDYAVELSSQRTREAQAVLDGLRQNQSLPALLGYRLERALTQAGGTVPALIARLRRIASTAAVPVSTGGATPPESAAEAVCDGLALVRLATAELKTDVDLGRLGSDLQPPTPLDSAQKGTLVDALVALRDLVDAVSDVLLAESVYQLASGNPSRASGATDILSGAVPPPDRLDMLQPPERGIAVNHRVLLAFDHARALREGWPSGSPRSLADPDLDSWLNRLLPAPENILVRLLGADGSTNKVVTLRDLFDVWPERDPPLGALDLAFDVVEPGAVARSALEARLAAACEALTGATGLPFAWDRERDWPSTAYSIAEVTTIAGAARAVLGNARPLQPDDVPGTVAIDNSDLDARLQAVSDAATTARKQLDKAIGSAEQRPTARRWAAAFGLPSLAETPTAEACRAARDELDRRIAAAADTALPLRERIAALFDGQPVVPRLTGVDTALIKGFAGDLKVAPVELRGFIAKASRVRPALAAMTALDALVLRADDPATQHRLVVSQTPRDAGEAWVGSPKTPRRGRTSFVAWRLAKGDALDDPAQSVCALVLDRWSELVPAAEADAAIAFHTDAPSTTAPNAILLCVPAQNLERWSETLVLEHILEALALAKMRTVTPANLDAIAQFAPLSLIDNQRYQTSFGHVATGDITP